MLAQVLEPVLEEMLGEWVLELVVEAVLEDRVLELSSGTGSGTGCRTTEVLEPKGQKSYLYSKKERSEESFLDNEGGSDLRESYHSDNWLVAAKRS